MQYKPSANPEFSKPPLNEMVIGAVFQRPANLTTAHLGLFWARIRDQFPNTEDHSPIGDLTNVPLADGLPLPRIWLVQESENKLLQLQLDRLYFNWRHRRSDDRYPRFSVLRDSFREYWEMFCGFAAEVSGGPLILSGAELTKISYFPKEQGWIEFSEVGNILEPISVPRIEGLRQVTAVGFRYDCSFADANVVVELKTAKRKDDGSDMLRLEIKAQPEVKGLPAEEIGLFDRFDRANKLVNLIFTSITMQKAQVDVWERTA